MSSPSTSLRKIKRNPLPCSRSVPFRHSQESPLLPDESTPPSLSELLDTTTHRAIIDGIRHTGGAKRQNEDLLGSMAHRLAQVEKELLASRREIVEKDQLIQRLESRLASLDCAAEGRGQLEQRCLALQRQVEEMEEFFNDYGMVWVGDQPVSAITDHPPSTVTDHTPSAAHGMWSPGESVPQEAEVNFDLIVKHVEELNSLCNQTQIKSTSQGATIKRLDSVPFTLFKNGLVLFQGPFRPYTDPNTHQCIQDLSDGYFPSELQQRYPEGVPLQLTDCRDTVFRAREMSDMFPGCGMLLGGEKGPSRLLSRQPGEVCDHGPKVPVEKFLSRLPASVVRGGRVVDIRSSIAQTLQGSDVQVVSTPVMEELRTRLELGEDQRPPTPSHTTTLRVRAADKTYVLKMRYSDTIAKVREYIDQLRGSASGYELHSTFPPRTFTDQSQTLAQCGLVPSANLFIVQPHQT